MNVMHPVQDIHSWKASLVPDIRDYADVFMSNVTNYFGANFDLAT